MRFPIRNPFRHRVQALVDQGIAAETAGDAPSAMRHYTQAIEADPGHAPAHCNLGLLHLQAGDYLRAEGCFRSALRLRDDLAEAWIGLAEALEAAGRIDEALDALRRIAEGHAHYGHALHARIELLGALGRRGETVPLLFEAVARKPGDSHLRHRLAGALRGATIGNAGPRERAVLARLCADDDVSASNLATAIAAILKGTTMPELAGDPLLLAALPRTSFADAALESRLTQLRRGILLGELEAPLEFTCALARHCFISEYAFCVSADEAARIGSIREAAESVLRNAPIDTPALESLLARVALYRSLNTLQGAERLLALQWSKPFAPVVEEQVADRRRERELAGTISALTPIDDAVSQAVRAQYEENPYPLWVNAQHPGIEPIEALSRRLRPGRGIRDRARPVPILVAGCGTGLHPIQVARAQPDSAILAVDLSVASLAYAARMARRHGVANITFAQADILKLGTLGRKFAIVESVGVLHHMQDPLGGWKVLAGLLEDDGLMRIALYSTRARTGIRAAREFLQALDLPRTPDGIRTCRRLVMELPAGHPARDALEFGDFYTLNGCRDLLMHVQEHTFTLPQIGKCLDELGLRFLGMECDPQALEGFRKMFPQAGALTDLGAWDRFEAANPGAFRAMYQFWCAR